jgi:hypothetical protein
MQEQSLTIFSERKQNCSENQAEGDERGWRWGEMIKG